MKSMRTEVVISPDLEVGLWKKEAQGVAVMKEAECRGALRNEVPMRELGSRN
jgi:hypothetical protein